MLLRNDKRIEGSVDVYAPLNQDGSENPITRIWAVDENDTELSVGLLCEDYEGNTNPPFKNAPDKDKQIKCRFRFDFPAGRDAFALKIKAQSESGARGRNTQSFFRDEVEPQITIEPDSAFTGGSHDFEFTFKVKIFDAVSMLNSRILLG